MEGLLLLEAQQRYFLHIARYLQRVPEPVDERQITHLICARLKYDLYDFFRGVLGLLPVLFLV